MNSKLIAMSELGHFKAELHNREQIMLCSLGRAKTRIKCVELCGVGQGLVKLLRGKEAGEAFGHQLKQARSWESVCMF